MRSKDWAFAAVIALGAAAPATAHETASGQDYTKYRQPNGASCCNGRDCRPVGYRLRPDGGVVMYPEGQAILVPRSTLHELPSDDGQAHWCGVMLPGAEPQTFCAILPRQMTRFQAPEERKLHLNWALFVGVQGSVPAPDSQAICRGGR